MLNKAFYIVLFLSLSCSVQAQKIMRNTSLLNYQRGDRTVLHFGFSLGINYMDYKAVLSGANGLRAESGKLDVGFLVGIVSELRLCDDLGLRFLPGLEFATRSLVYTQVPEVENNKQYAYNESVYVSLPLMLKYKAKRINNFRPFITAGSSGSDFYLPYFKFGIELRFSLGLTDVLVHRPDPKNPGYEDYTQSLSKLHARVFTICFNFE